MKKIGILAAITMAATLIAGSAFADSEIEKCKVAKEGKSLIKADKADGIDGNESFINVPVGQCEKINAGDFSNVSQEIKDKIEGAK